MAQNPVRPLKGPKRYTVEMPFILSEEAGARVRQALGEEGETRVGLICEAMFRCDNAWHGLSMAGVIGIQILTVQGITIPLLRVGAAHALAEAIEEEASLEDKRAIRKCQGEQKFLREVIKRLSNHLIVPVGLLGPVAPRPESPSDLTERAETENDLDEDDEFDDDL